MDKRELETLKNLDSLKTQYLAMKAGEASDLISVSVKIAEKLWDEQLNKAKKTADNFLEHLFK